MKFLLFTLLTTVLYSCFLFKNFKKDRFSFSENGEKKDYKVLVPKGFKSKETKTDSLGNMARYYYYKHGAVLYFADLKDTSVTFQWINYEENIPLVMYHTVFYKGVDAYSDHYWRETRFGNYKAGYKNVELDKDWKFDSSINYFSLRSVKPVQ